MRTIILIVVFILMLAVLVTCSVTAKPDIRLSAGPFPPEQEAAAYRTRLLAEVERDHNRAMAAIEESKAAANAALAVVTRERMTKIMVYFTGALAGLILCSLAGVLVYAGAIMAKRATVPATVTIAPHLVIVRSPGGELRVVDSLTGANYALLADRSPDQLRAGSVTRIELAAILAGHQVTDLEGWELVPAVPAERGP